MIAVIDVILSASAKLKRSMKARALEISRKEYDKNSCSEDGIANLNWHQSSMAIYCILETNVRIY